MADDVTVHNNAPGDGTAFDVAADEATGGKKIQLVKLTYSADGSRTHLPADADGLLVNLGANNDVTLAKGAKTFSNPAPTTSATLVLAANASRLSAVIVNDGTVKCYLGKDNTVTASNGIPIQPNGGVLVDGDSTDAWWGITAAGTADLRVCEVA